MKRLFEQGSSQNADAVQALQAENIKLMSEIRALEARVQVSCDFNRNLHDGQHSHERGNRSD